MLFQRLLFRNTRRAEHCNKGPVRGRRACWRRLLWERREFGVAAEAEPCQAPGHLEHEHSTCMCAWVRHRCFDLVSSRVERKQPCIFVGVLSRGEASDSPFGKVFFFLFR